MYYMDYKSNGFETGYTQLQSFKTIV